MPSRISVPPAKARERYRKAIRRANPDMRLAFEGPGVEAAYLREHARTSLPRVRGLPDLVKEVRAKAASGLNLTVDGRSVTLRYQNFYHFQLGRLRLRRRLTRRLDERAYRATLKRVFRGSLEGVPLQQLCIHPAMNLAFVLESAFRSGRRRSKLYANPYGPEVTCRLSPATSSISFVFDYSTVGDGYERMAEQWHSLSPSLVAGVREQLARFNGRRFRMDLRLTPADYALLKRQIPLISKDWGLRYAGAYSEKEFYKILAAGRA